MADVHRACLNDIFRLWHSYSLKFDSSLLLNRLDQLLGLSRVESDTSTAGAGSRRTATPMDVRLSLLGWLQLDDQIDVRDIKTSRGNVSGDENAELALLKSLHRDLSLILSNVSMHYLYVLLDFIGE